MTGQWLPIVLAALPMVDLGFRGFFENVFSNVADFQLGTALQRDNREKVKEVVRNKALIDILHIYFENGVRIRQVFPVVAVATLSVWGSVEELVTKGPVSETWYYVWWVYLSLAVIFVFYFLINLASGKIKLSRDPSIKRKRIESPRYYNTIAFFFDFIAIVFGIAAKVSG